MIRACALIAVLIAGALIDLARGGDLVECEPQRVTGDGRHWAYRIVDGRECWYPGRPGKPQTPDPMPEEWRATPRRPVARVHLLLAGVGGARPAPTADVRKRPAA